MPKSSARRILAIPQFKIGFAVGISGLSQAVIVLVPSLSLDAKETSDLILWQALSAGVGILLSSVLGVFTFSRILQNSVEEGETSPDFARLLPNFAYFFALVLLILLPTTFRLFEEERVFLTIYLAISLFGYLLMAIQRNYYAAMADWNAVSFQFGIDGFIRLIATALIVRYFESSVFVLILASVLSQALAIGLPTLISPWWQGFRKSNKRFRSFLLEIVPLVSTTLGGLAFTTFPPVFLKFIGAPMELVAALGVFMILLRIPSTVLNPLVLPQVRDISQHHLKGFFQLELSLFAKTVLRLLLVAIPAATFMSLFVLKLTFLSGDNETINQVSFLTRLLIIIIGTSFVLEGFANSCINSQGRFAESGFVYFVMLIIFLFALSQVGNSVNSALAALLLASSLSFIWLCLRILVGARQVSPI